MDILFYPLKMLATDKAVSQVIWLFFINKTAISSHFLLPERLCIKFVKIPASATESIKQY
ncbi:MAG: hypothetical protein NTX38_17935 [Methylobacter sp.]|nr:hypothetical protein [Methylobacter sp.]